MNHTLIHRATKDQSDTISILVGELLQEIMDRIGIDVFHFDLEETKERLAEFIEHEKNFVFVAFDQNTDEMIGFVTVYEGFALYVEGAFGTMAELYVRPSYRSQSIGKMLIQAVKDFGDERGWKRLEVTTPPLPQFDATLSFYEREGFEISGGRKLKVVVKK
ncbi:MAG: GNAT family N-acetyltransferase [Sulfuricurvum sp.]|uniref:GNAT family N-acetyltransferase n=1 Tax=Sulfuricurvum sp. TaxID=2025608 RepID=UPI00262CB705|nr:GNAT family N-acetyltransferase [Sulfuricurvum sp.]MDD2830450.1 GNAT family N-acetyltransferase [Sulfuricurvum sp.]MDD4950757.1 GNAT family N-acetyltransferase [Sulfuricurvum sp.]